MQNCSRSGGVSRPHASQVTFLLRQSSERNARVQDACLLGSDHRLHLDRLEALLGDAKRPTGAAEPKPWDVIAPPPIYSRWRLPGDHPPGRSGLISYLRTCRTPSSMLRIMPPPASAIAHLVHGQTVAWTADDRCALVGARVGSVTWGGPACLHISSKHQVPPRRQCRSRGGCTFQGRQRPILIRYQTCGAAALLRATPPARPASGTTDYEVLCSGGVVGRVMKAAAKPVDAS
jgi:hypothetical protein